MKKDENYLFHIRNFVNDLISRRHHEAGRVGGGCVARTLFTWSIPPTPCTPSWPTEVRRAVTWGTSVAPPPPLPPPPSIFAILQIPCSFFLSFHLGYIRRWGGREGLKGLFNIETLIACKKVVSHLYFSQMYASMSEYLNACVNFSS